MPTDEWIILLAGAFLGSLLTLALEFARSQFERRQRQADRRADFQRETLLALQDAAIRAGVLSAKIHMLIQGNQTVDTKFDEETRLALLEVGKLSVRVYDDQARALTVDFTEAADPGAMKQAAANHSTLRDELISRLTDVNDRIGELLRKL